MKKILIVPDSFKGTMSSTQICEQVCDAAQTVWPDVETVSIPVADGGEGSIDCFLSAMGGEKVFVPVSGPYGEPMEGYYGKLPDGTAIVEMAVCAGLPLVGDRKNPEKTTTYGVGQLMLQAAKDGAKEILCCIGGSATNDGGCGAAAACGVRFLDSDGKSFVPTGETLSQIAAVDVSALDSALVGVFIRTMCDIDHPLTGPMGAAAVFAPQKGADEAMVARLDAGLCHLAAIVRRDLAVEMESLPGSGAAGGLGGGMAAFFHSPLCSGIETVLEIVGFDRLLSSADLVITGEGKMDTQSLRGKVAIGVARHCKAAGVPCVAIVGDIGEDIQGAYNEGISGIFTINRIAAPYQTLRTRALTDLRWTAENLFRFYQAVNK